MIRFPVSGARRLALPFQIRCSSLSVFKALHKEPVNSQVIEDALLNKTFTEGELQDLHKLLKAEVSSEVANEVLRHGLPQDFSLYFTLSNLGKSHQWNDLALLSLIESNPGRVASLLELAKKHSNGPISRAVSQAVLKKLLYGEKVELRDGEFELNEENIRKAIGILNELAVVDTNEEYLTTIFDFLIANGAAPSLGLLELEGLAEWLSHQKLALISEKAAFLQVAKVVFDSDPLLLSKEALAKVLAYTAEVLTFEHDLKASKVLANLGFSKAQLDESAEQLLQFGEKALAYIEHEELDCDKRDPESLLLRMQLITTYGINHNNIQIALEKFHKYQTHEKFGIELVQSKLVQAFCYQSFKHFDETSYRIAETLIVPDELPVSTICQLILASSQFDGERSLKIFNDYIGQVSRNLNPNTNRSPAGKLTQAMMIASIYENDREFAQLLFEKAVANKMVCEEEIPALKKVFKVYGEAFEEDSWERAKPKLLEYVLANIKNI